MGVFNIFEEYITSNKDKNKSVPLMNLKTELKEEELSDLDSISDIVKDAKKLESGLGSVILYNDGSLRKGFNPDLIQRRGVFNILRGDTQRFYWGDGNHFFDSDPYFIENNQLFIGFQSGHSRFQIYDKPIFTLEGLYKHHGVKEAIGILRKRENIEGKINFLEEFLIKKDKSGYQPKDMLVKNPRLRLKLLETHYKQNSSFYARQRLM